MRVVPIEELEVGDRVAVQISSNTIEIYTVKEVFPDEEFILLKELDLFHYYPDNTDQIIVLNDD